jgi:hypothetical protein
MILAPPPAARDPHRPLTMTIGRVPRVCNVRRGRRPHAGTTHIAALGLIHPRLDATVCEVIIVKGIIESIGLQW